MTSSVLVLQRLASEWGREGRSAALSALRRELPKAYPLPALADLGGVVAVAQNAEWSDADAFAMARETVLKYGRLADLSKSQMEVTHTDADGWQLLPLPLAGLGGKLRLAVGQLARFEWNERLGERCRHTVVNVTLCAGPIRSDLLMRLPDLYQSHMIELRDKKVGWTR